MNEQRLSLKGLSLYQPWASAMRARAKMIETRDWRTDYRGWLAIHAAKKWNRELAGLALEEPFRSALFETEPLFDAAPDNLLPRGAFVAVGLLRHCLSTDRYRQFIPPKTSVEYALGDYSEGRFMWVFDVVIPMPAPVYALGQRRLWTVTGGALDVIEEMLLDKPEFTQAGGLSAALNTRARD